MQEESIRDLLRDTATRLFGDLCQPAALRLAETGTWPQTMWAAVEDAGLPRALVPEAAGGHGVGFAEAMVVVRAAGYHALPVPLPETMAAAWLLARAGLPVPDGPLTLASGEDIRISPSAISGHAPRVPWARAPLGIVAIDPAGRVALVPPAACRIEPGANVAGEPRDTVHFDGTLTAIGETGLAPSNAPCNKTSPCWRDRPPPPVPRPTWRRRAWRTADGFWRSRRGKRAAGRRRESAPPSRIRYTARSASRTNTACIS